MAVNHKKINHQKKNDNLRKVFFWVGMFFVLLYVSNLISAIKGIAPQERPYGEFYQLLLANPEEHKIKSVTMMENVLQGEFSDGSKFIVNVPERDEKLLDLLRQNVPQFDVKPLRTFWSSLFLSLAPMLLFISVLWYFSYRGSQLGNKVWAFGRARAKTSTETASARVTFKDVAGVDEAKEELGEVIEFLKDPKRFQRLGGKIPKGVLLIGPPGTGKTLLAKAVAGEAGVPFFSISGSDFVEMFVGVGASRVRDLFEQGRHAAKTSGRGCIIFIDEIDAVGRLRFSGIGGGHDEREQTLNALLVEMDGFDTQEGVILIAATNRPDTLDPALLRPGRFDRHIVVPLPDIAGREAILRVHIRGIRIAPNVDLKVIAQQTSGFSGADLANLCNEAALLAARENKEAVTMSELEAAIERVMIGPAKKSRVIPKREREITAYHESGHALLSLLLPGVDPLRKVSIIPRGMAGGYTLTPPVEDRYFWGKRDLESKLIVALGGRVAEELFMGDITTGAENDLEMVTRLARRMVCEFGMSSKLGNMTLGRRHGPLFLGRDIVEERDYSEDTAKVIDEEVRSLVNKAYEKAKALLKDNREKLNTLANALLEKEVLDVAEVRQLLLLPASA
ncbi:MAG: ATP-dependent zinc metalloprotease FtsH [Candidatus Omnitrophota bacterium]